MSYEIIYGKQFIRLADDKFIPILYWGSNNCYDIRPTGRQRRERSFSQANFLSKGNFAVTGADILSNLEDLRNSLISSNENYLKDNPDWDKYEDGRFSYFAGLTIQGNTSTSFSQIKSLVTDAIKKALTVEEILQIGANVSVYHYAYDKEKFHQKHGFYPLEAYPKTNDELMEILAQNESKGADTPNLSICIMASDYIVTLLKSHHSKPKVKREKTRKELDHFYTIYIPNTGYLTKVTSRRYRYSYSDTGGKIFETEKKALAYFQKISDRIRCEVKRIDKPVTVIS